MIFALFDRQNMRRYEPEFIVGNIRTLLEKTVMDIHRGFPPNKKFHAVGSKKCLENHSRHTIVYRTHAVIRFPCFHSLDHMRRIHQRNVFHIGEVEFFHQIFCGLFRIRSFDSLISYFDHISCPFTFCRSLLSYFSAADTMLFASRQPVISLVRPAPHRPNRHPVPGHIPAMFRPALSFSNFPSFP